MQNNYKTIDQLTSALTDLSALMKTDEWWQDIREESKGDPFFMLMLDEIDRLRAVERKYYSMLLEQLKMMRSEANGLQTIYFSDGLQPSKKTLRELVDAGLMAIVAEKSGHICSASLTPAGAEMMEG